MVSEHGRRVHGVVDRISGSGNAILKNAGGKEWNLGPLPNSLVNEEMDALTLGGTWALCLEPSYITEDYLEKARISTDFEENEVYNWDFIESKEALSKVLIIGELREPPSKHISTDDRIEVEFSDSSFREVEIAHHNNSIVFVDTPYSVAGLGIEVTVVEIEEFYIKAEIDTPVKSLPIHQGDSIDFEVEKMEEQNILGIYRNVPVSVSHGGRLSNALLGQRIRAQVKELQEDRIVASLAVSSSSTVEVGDEHMVSVIGRSSGRILGLAAQTPIMIESESILREGDELRVAITAVYQEWATGSVSALPDCPSIGDVIHASLTNHSRYTLLNGVPVTVPSGLRIQHEVHLGVEKINSDGVFATVRALPSDKIPDPGDIIRASVVQTSLSGTLAVSSNIPVLLPIYGISEGIEVAVTVTDVEAAWIQGFIESIEAGEEGVKFSDHQEHIQSGTIDVRQESFADAAVHFTAAAEEVAKISGGAASLPKYAAVLSTVLHSVHQDHIPEAKASAKHGIEMLPENIDDADMQVLVDLCRYRFQAVIHLLEAIEGVSGGTSSNPLQQIYQESLARSPLRSTTQFLQEAEDTARGTPYEDMVPGILLQRLLWLVRNHFSSSVHDLAGWTPESSPELDQFTWPYQFAESVHDSEKDTDSDYEETQEPAELSTIDIDAGTSEEEPTTVEPEPTDTEPVDAEDGPAVETSKPRDTGSEITGGSVQRSSDEVPSSSGEDDGTTVQTETVEESPTAYEPDASSSDTEDSGDDESQTFEVADNHKEGGENTGLSELRAQAEKKARSDPVRDTSPEATVGSRYQRAPAIRDYALARADGICECCGEPAPFRKPSGEPYLEVHHVDELGRGGEDHPDKVVALCPVCHKRIHHGEDGRSINRQLAEKLDAGLADVGTE